MSRRSRPHNPPTERRSSSAPSRSAFCRTSRFSPSSQHSRQRSSSSRACRGYIWRLSLPCQALYPPSMTQVAPPEYHRVTHTPPEHLAHWELPPGWSWGSEGVFGEYRHYQEVIDALG